MPKSCLVAFCRNRGKLAGIRYFRILEKRKVLWLRAIGRHCTQDISQHNVICSEHFSKEDYLESGKLKDEAVPSLKLKPERPVLAFRTRLETSPSTSGLVSLEDIDSSCNISQASPISFNETESQLPIQLLKPLKILSSDSVGLLVTLKKKRRMVRLDHSYSLSSRKMRSALVKTKRVAMTLRTKVSVLKQQITRLKHRVRTLNGLVAHLRSK